MRLDTPPAIFLKRNRLELLDAMVLASMSIPPTANDKMYRSLIPRFLNAAISRRFSSDIVEICESDGLPYDWIIQHFNLSVKSFKRKAFPRPGCIGTPIALKNSKTQTCVLDGEFDQLLVVAMPPADKLSFGMYLLSKDRVMELLKNSRGCDENGYDGKGQILLYLRDKNDCLAWIEMDVEAIEVIKNKNYRTISGEKRDMIFKGDIESCVNNQIDLTLGKKI